MKKIEFHNQNNTNQESDATNIIPDNMPKKKNRFKLARRKKIIVASVFVAIALILMPLAFIAFQANNVYQEAQKTAAVSQEALASLKSQDLIAAGEKLDAAYASAEALQNQYNALGLLNITPLRWHFRDGQHALNAGIAGIEAAQIVVASIEPYADVLGLKGEGSFAGGTIEDRIGKILETLQVVTPSLEEASKKIDYAQTEIAQIDAERYPISIQGKAAQDIISDVQTQLEEGNQTLSDLIPILKVLPEIAGVSSEKKYLVMFQNDAELRPTGGFMTAYAVLDINKGKVTPLKSDDIYELDNKFDKRLQAPEPILKYLPLVNNWNLRDMNLSPDFKESMDVFLPYYNELPGETQVDGIIAIDTQVLSDLVALVGPVDVPGYGVFTAETDPRCNCPQVIYELEDISTRPTPYLRSDRKAVLGPLMQTILLKAYDLPTEKWPQLFTTIWRNVNEKHVLFYFFDETAQKAAEQNNFAGRMQQVDTDFLHINDSNFAGAKSNMFVSQKVDQKISFQDGVTRKTIEVTYKNPQKGDNCNLEAGQLCLNGILRSWVRFYVPQGTTLVDSKGFKEGTVETSSDLGYAVIEGFYTLNPQSQTKLVLTIDVPYTPQEETYDVYLQKQPGTKAPKHTITLPNNQIELDLVKDEALQIPLVP